MSKKQIIGRYLDIDSFFHRVSPITKITMFFVLSILSIVSKDILGYIIFSLTLLFAVTFTKIGLKNFLKTIKPIMMIFLFSLVFQILFNKDGDLLYQLGFITIYTEGLILSINLFFRMFILIGVAGILTLSTSPNEITHGFEDLLKPLKIIKVPGETIALTLSIALRFIPFLFDEVERIKIAQQSKGYDIDELGYLSKFKYYSLLLIPLLLSSIQRAEDVASAMEVRAYGAHTEKTRFREYKISRYDYILLVIFGVLVVVNILIKK